MNLLPRRSMLAIAAVVDVALYARPMPVAAKSLAARHHLPPRHLETLLQGLVQANILKGVRERRKITAGEVVRTALALSAAEPSEIGGASKLVKRVIEPSVRKAGDSFLANLDAITVEDLCAESIAARILEDDKNGGDFAI
jgi:Rrf2 family iron-sulfur cluster assembly transcriptional regulator